MRQYQWIAEHDLPPDKASGILIVRDGRKQIVYAVSPVPSDWGRAYRLNKVEWDGEATRVVATYHTLIDAVCWCDCTGHERYGKCKHVEALHHLTRGE